MNDNCVRRFLNTTRGACAIAITLAWSLASPAEAQEYFDPPGRHYEVTAEGMPAPRATRSVMGFPGRGMPSSGKLELHLPAGFEANVFFEGGRSPRMIRSAPGGDFFLVDSSANQILVLRDADGDGKAEFNSVFATGLSRPFGVAFAPGFVYVANTGSLVRFPYQPGDTKAGGPAEVVIEKLPAGGANNHWTRNLLFSPDGTKLHITVGSRSNVGEDPPMRAAILQCNPDGSDLRIFASGLRNPTALAWNPATGDLWTSVNERDMLGDNLVPDYVTSVKEGGFYGWPYYYIGANPDPQFGSKKPELASKVIVPDVLLESHSAALGMRFYDGEMFPEEYRGDLFVALHGSWNRSKKTGYKIIRVRMNDGKPAGGYENFLTGWLPEANTSQVWGRPVSLIVAPDGAMLIVDDHGRKVWRVSYSGS